jgi:hypothetical protein
MSRQKRVDGSTAVTRIACGLLAALVVCGAASAQAPAGVAFASPDGAYRAVFPCAPTRQPLPAARPGSIARAYLSCGDDALFAAVMELSLAVVLDNDAVLGDRRKELLGLSKGELIGEERSTASGYPGHIMRMATPENLLIVVRLVLVPESRRLYQLTSVVQRGSKDESKALAFIDSFVVLKAPPPDTTGLDPRSLSFLLAAANSANESMPMRIDKDTEIMNTTAMEGIFVYNNRLVNHAAADLDAAKLRELLKPTVTNASCSNPTLKNLLDAGVTIRYTYSDKDRRMITQFDVTPADCAAK